MLLFGLTAADPLAETIAHAAGVPLSAFEERMFEDGEHKARPRVSVRGADVYVIDSLHGDSARTVNDRLCRMLFFIGAVHDAGAARVTAVVPYLCYSRKDRRTKPRDPVTTRYIAAMFEAVGADAVVTMDVHNVAAYQNAFRIRAEHLEARPLFVSHFGDRAGENPVTVVSPDAGGVKRAEALRESLMHALGRDVGMAFMEKRRHDGALSGDAVVGDVEGSMAIIVDDLISTGSTLARAARACVERGAAQVHAAATHALFTEAADQTLGLLEHLVVANTVAAPGVTVALQRGRPLVLDAGPLIGEAIRRMHEGGSIADLLSDPQPVG
jgi:ribose-phosphate pyrophosphokinase